MSSTAIVMATLGERGELGAEHGRVSFAVLMAQDMWVVPVMAMVPILAHTTAHAAETPRPSASATPSGWSCFSPSSLPPGLSTKPASR